MKTLIVILILSTAAWGVTEEDITVQKAAVLNSQATLDSLCSLLLAETTEIDSLIFAASVRVLVVTSAKATGLRDPEFVDIDVPYSTWDSLTKREWAVELREGPKHTAVGVGLYSVRKDRVAAFLTMTKAFLTRDLVVAEEIK